MVRLSRNQNFILKKLSAYRTIPFSFRPINSRLLKLLFENSYSLDCCDEY